MAQEVLCDTFALIGLLLCHVSAALVQSSCPSRFLGLAAPLLSSSLSPLELTV
jgi:hypothetical protein